MAKETESWITLSDGTKLFTKTWEPPSTSPRAHLIYIHGFSDRCEMNHALFPTLSSSPHSITTHSFDQRGWGKSVQKPSDRGNAGPTSLVLSDLHEFVKHVQSTSSKGAPLFLMGHSMGGQILLHYSLTTLPALTRDRPKISGIVVAAPYIALDPRSQPSSFTVVTGKLAAKILPKFQLLQKLDSKFNCHDPAVNKEWEEDVLCHDLGTLEQLRDMLQRAADLVTLTSPTIPPASLNLSTQLPVPTTWHHGTQDKITAFHPSKSLFDRLDPPPIERIPPGIQGKTFKAWEDAYHKIQCEPDGVGIKFATEIGEWIGRIVDADANTESGIGSKSQNKGKDESVDRVEDEMARSKL